MKSKETRRKEASIRSKSYTWENSKAKRLGTATREQWEASNKAIGEPSCQK